MAVNNMRLLEEYDRKYSAMENDGTFLGNFKKR